MKVELVLDHIIPAMHRYHDRGFAGLIKAYLLCYDTDVIIEVVIQLFLKQKKQEAEAR